ncbi:acyl carrier protein [Fomitiporia mediterranea MF3/22]|uniref:acyl carrier protein n=1 Tax=Fomitiporia mediterranea (strain MF3/22) TaxID=694068 RepID=UPI00044074F1|nr:acyl carrier protein [Fomitiporia mediterranea MF3/22]EJD03565.1 acyl carrier protein [Fomitiporia mediterranea MF3/22]
MTFLRAAFRSIPRARPVSAIPRAALFTRQNLALQRAAYSAAAALSRSDIQARIFDVVKSFEKVDPSKVTDSASFAGDLGLDSLDAVEVVMAVEEEFGIEIPDAEADEIQTVQQAIDYIAKTPDAK